MDAPFNLEKLDFVVEIALASARKNDSEIRIQDKQDLLHAFRDGDLLSTILYSCEDLLNSGALRG